MRRAKAIITNVVAITLLGSFAAADDDLQVIHSQKSVLSIYSVGGAERTRILPELPERTRRNTESTGALSDVISTPPLSLSLPIQSTGKSGGSSSTKSTGATRGSTNSAMTGRTSSISDPSPSATPRPRELPNPQTITVGWEPSPDQSVVGYYLYIGNASHQYSGKQPMGNQTSASVVVGQGAVYVAVSAYTAEGFESILSEELVVNGVTRSTTASFGLSATTH